MIRTVLPALAAGALLLTGTAPAAAAAALHITVTGIANDRGEVRVAACAEETFLTEGCRLVAAVPAQPGAVELTIPDVPPGVYAIQAFHDENGNRDIDRSFFGTPREGIGFSNGARMNYGPPKFAEAAVTVGSDDVTTGFALVYFD